MLALSVAMLAGSVTTLAGLVTLVVRRQLVGRAVPQGRHARWT